ncbi:conserved hypothetical protein [Histoplasma capsulatum G186AR]|uniref:Uncharacterized protein n=1 Tax=Ajellomyces capsulatus (strain G186AR / H82 / ATCC MYA-2454 / RMSCC 2432) TaxID=447093 RepID=C0NPR3_AJECG|nr:uncharacterized protein HCBG_05143 [Histoplasma capsulatum G186AR]EEH06923.1 conserved hypothetical protein [Histoplasma capsulatum G186AR]
MPDDMHIRELLSRSEATGKGNCEKTRKRCWKKNYIQEQVHYSSKNRRIIPESKKEFLQQILPRPISRETMVTRFRTGESGHMQEFGVVGGDRWRHFMTVLLRHSGLVGNMLGIHSMHFANGKRALLGRLSTSEDDERPPPDNEIALQPEHQNGSQASLEGDEKKPKICQKIDMDTNEKHEQLLLQEHRSVQRSDLMLTHMPIFTATSFRSSYKGVPYLWNNVKTQTDLRELDINDSNMVLHETGIFVVPWGLSVRGDGRRKSIIRFDLPLDVIRTEPDKCVYLEESRPYNPDSSWKDEETALDTRLQR